MDGSLIAPQSEQGQHAVRESLDRIAPDIGRHNRARPGPMIGDLLSFGDKRGEHRHPSNPATFWNHTTRAGGNQIPAISTSAKWAKIGR